MTMIPSDFFPETISGATVVVKSVKISELRVAEVRENVIPMAVSPITAKFCTTRLCSHRFRKAGKVTPATKWRVYCAGSTSLPVFPYETSTPVTSIMHISRSAELQIINIYASVVSAA
jgi:hypothetical protein